MAEWPCCHDPLRSSPASHGFVPPPSPTPLSPAGPRLPSLAPHARDIRLSHAQAALLRTLPRVCLSCPQACHHAARCRSPVRCTLQARLACPSAALMPCCCSSPLVALARSPLTRAKEFISAVQHFAAALRTPARRQSTHPREAHELTAQTTRGSPLAHTRQPGHSRSPRCMRRKTSTAPWNPQTKVSHY